MVYSFSVFHDGWSKPVRRSSIKDGFSYLLKHSLISDGDTIKIHTSDELTDYTYIRYFLFSHSYFLKYYDSRKSHYVYRVGDNNEVLFK